MTSHFEPNAKNSAGRARTSLTALISLALLSGLSLSCAHPAQAQEPALKDAPHIDLAAMSGGAVAKSLPLLQKGDAGFREHIGNACYSCHNQSLPSMAFAIARQHGFTLNRQQTADRIKQVHGMFDMLRPVMVKAQTNPATDRELDQVTVDPSLSVGYALAGLAADDCKPDAATEAATRYLMRKQLPDGRWPVLTARPPLESSEFTATALAIRAMQTYAPKSCGLEVARRMALARTWLLSAYPKTTEDKAFRLYGLCWTGAAPKDIKTAVDCLLILQQDDGGWGQLPRTPSDAYATGQALMALSQAGGISVKDSVYTRGAFFLFATQREDGSWLVNKRANPVQAFFDSGFPHDKSQFVSMAATSWATMALALMVPATSVTSPILTAR